MAREVSIETKENAKEVICALIAAAGGKLKGKLRLYKGFYHAHLLYWKATERVLTEYPIVHMPMGPGIDDADILLGELRDEGRISITKAPTGANPEHVYRLLQPCDIGANDPRGIAITEAYDLIKGKASGELSDITHRSSRSWRETPLGAEQPIYIDLLSIDESRKVRARVRDIEDLVYDAFVE